LNALQMSMRQGCNQYEQDYAGVHLHFVSGKAFLKIKDEKLFVTYRRVNL